MKEWEETLVDSTMVEALVKSFGNLAARSIVTGSPGGQATGLRADDSPAFVVFLAFNPTPAQISSVNILSDMLEKQI